MLSRRSPIVEAVPEIARLVPNAISTYSDSIASKLGLRDENSSSRVENFYIPLFVYLTNLMSKRNASSKPRPFLVGISAPQGCGKTTLTDSLNEAFKTSGKLCVSLSLDDFYLTGEEQDQLASENPDNELLQCRGNAGTHDVGLLFDTLNQLNAADANKVTSIPRYDKSMRGGRGDRAGPEAWSTVIGKPDVILLEGWMLGFKRLNDDSAVLIKYPSLKTVNENLERYEKIHHLIDTWIVMAVDDPSYVYEWRLQAEHAMKASGRAGMTDEQISDFVGRYMPAYEAYLPGLYAHGPDRSIRDPCDGDLHDEGVVKTLKIFMQSDRTPYEAHVD